MGAIEAQSAECGVQGGGGGLVHADAEDARGDRPKGNWVVSEVAINRAHTELAIVRNYVVGLADFAEGFRF